MRICLVAHTNDLSGGNRALIELAEGLENNNIDVVVALPRKGPIEQKLHEKGISYRIIGFSSWIDRKGSKKRIIKRIINFTGGVYFAIFCKLNKVTLVHYNSSAVGVGVNVLRKMKIPYVWHVREFIDNKQMKFHSIKNVFRAYQGAQYLIAISQSVKNENLHAGRAGNWVYISDGVPIHHLNKYSDDDYNNFIIVGGIENNKNQLDAVKAVRVLKTRGKSNIKLYIVGPIIEKNYYQEIISYIDGNNLSDNVVWMGKVDNPSLIRKKCGIALVCSKYEAFGRVTVEALMSGETVIGADAGGTFEILSSINAGMLYHVGDITGLSDAMERAMKNCFVNEDVNIVREKTINNYGVEHSINEVISLYKSI